MSKKDRSLTAGTLAEESLSKIQNTSIALASTVQQGRRNTVLMPMDPSFVEEDHESLAKQERVNALNTSPLLKSVVTMLDRQGFDSKREGTIERLALEVNPLFYDRYASVFIIKRGLIPDFLLKRLAIQNDLVAAITRTRATQIGSFGRHQIDRFATGFRIQPLPGILERADKEQKKDIQERITRAVKNSLRAVLPNDCHIKKK